MNARRLVKARWAGDGLSLYQNGKTGYVVREHWEEGTLVLKGARLSNVGAQRSYRYPAVFGYLWQEGYPLGHWQVAVWDQQQSKWLDVATHEEVERVGYAKIDAARPGKALYI